MKRDLVVELIGACETSEQAAFDRLFRADATALVDGGGHVPAPAQAVRGRRAVSALVREITSREAGLRFEEREVNGTPGIAMRSGNRVVGVLSVAFDGAQICDIWIMLNPDKLCDWNIN